MAAVVAGVGYAIARAQDPASFRFAFQYELEERNTLTNATNPVFVVSGRFGFRPVYAVGSNPICFRP